MNEPQKLLLNLRWIRQEKNRQSMMWKGTEKVKYEEREGLAYISFADPPQNLMDTLFFDELRLIIGEIKNRKDQLSAIIVKGGERHFSAGADLDNLLKMISAEKQEAWKKLLDNYDSFRFFEELHIPVIATIKGVCIGSAFELAMHCHFRLCADNAVLGLPESSFGLIPGAGGIQQMMEMAGKAKTIDLVISGRNLSPATALASGLVDLVLPKAKLPGSAGQLATICSENYRKYKKPEYLQKLQQAFSLTNTERVPD